MNQIWKANVTVAALVAQGGRYLLVEEHTRDGLRLNQPAGHLEPHESLVDAVKREVLEETTRIFTPQGLLGAYLSGSGSKSGQDTTYLRFAFVGSVGEALAARQFDKGIVANLWLTIEELRACPQRHRSPLVLQCIEDHYAGKNLVSLDFLFTHTSAL